MHSDPRRPSGILRVLCVKLLSLPQPEAAGDDAAQDFASATLDRQFGRDQGRVAQCLFEPLVVAVGLGITGLRRQQPHLVRQCLLEIGAEILDHRGFDRRRFAGLQHAGNRQ